MPVWISDGTKWTLVGQPSVQTPGAVRPVTAIYRRNTPTTSSVIWERSLVGYLLPQLTVEPRPRTRNGFAVTVKMPDTGVLRLRRVVVKVRAGSAPASPSGTADTLRRNPSFPNGLVGLSPGDLADENEWSDFFQGERYRDLRGDISYGSTQTKFTDTSVNRSTAVGVYGELPLGTNIYISAWAQYSDGAWSEPDTKMVTTRSALQDPFGIQTFTTVVEPISTDNYAAVYDTWTQGNLSQGGTNRDYGMIFYGLRVRQVFQEADKSGVSAYDRRVTGMRLRLVRWGDTGYGAVDTVISVGVSRNGTLDQARNGVDSPASTRVPPNGPEVFQRWSYAPYWIYPAPGRGRSTDVALPPEARSHFFAGTGGGARSLVLGDGYEGRPADPTPHDSSRTYFRANPVQLGNTSSSGYLTITWRGYENPWPRSTPGAANFKPMQGEPSN